MRELSDFEKYLRDADLEALRLYKSGSAPPPVIYKDTGSVVAAVEKTDKQDGKPMIFVASEETEDRLGDVITSAGWDVKNFEKNPVFLYGHDQHIPPIGAFHRVWVDEQTKQLLATPKWDEADDFAKLIKGKYERGFMKAVSVGFRALDFEERQIAVPTPMQDTGLTFKRQELIEISAVPVPAHPGALLKALEMRRFWSLPSSSDPATKPIKKAISGKDVAELIHKEFAI